MVGIIISPALVLKIIVIKKLDNMVNHAAKARDFSNDSRAELAISVIKKTININMIAKMSPPTIALVF